MRIISKRLDSVNFLRLATRICSKLNDGGQKTTNNDTYITHFISHFKQRAGSEDEKDFEERRAALQNEFFYKEQQRLLRKLRDKLKERRNQHGRSKSRGGTSDKGNRQRSEDNQQRETLKPEFE